jgi:hypothetical protein
LEHLGRFAGWSISATVSEYSSSEGLNICGGGRIISVNLEMCCFTSDRGISGWAPRRFLTTPREIRDHAQSWGSTYNGFVLTPLLERRANPDDRRLYSLHLTKAGGEVLERIGKVAREDQDALLSALTREEREVLSTLLLRVADQRDLFEEFIRDISDSEAPNVLRTTMHKAGEAMNR